MIKIWSRKYINDFLSLKKTTLTLIQSNKRVTTLAVICLVLKTDTFQ